MAVLFTVLNEEKPAKDNIAEVALNIIFFIYLNFYVVDLKRFYMLLFRLLLLLFAAYV